MRLGIGLERDKNNSSQVAVRAPAASARCLNFVELSLMLWTAFITTGLLFQHPHKVNILRDCLPEDVPKLCMTFLCLYITSCHINIMFCKAPDYALISSTLSGASGNLWGRPCSATCTACMSLFSINNIKCLQPLEDYLFPPNIMLTLCLITFFW